MSVIFTSNKPFDRAENIKAVFNAYSGQKAFVKTVNWLQNPDMSHYTLRVSDEFITASPSKAIFIGHGFGAVKTGGLDQPHPYYSDKYAGLMDYIVTTSEEMIPLVAKQCGVKESVVLPLGMPRTDAYLNAQKGDGGTFLAKRRSYLYVPTWRTAEETPLPEIDWKYIDRHLTENEILAVKMHPMTGKILRRGYRHIVEISPQEASTPYLMDADVIITDYSSILFDAHLLKKPVVLFEKVRGYLDTRGVYFNYPYDYASRYATSEKELVDQIRSADGQREEDLRCVRRFASACDGHSTERVIELIESLL